MFIKVFEKMLRVNRACSRWGEGETAMDEESAAINVEKRGSKPPSC
jgi:hypothetical protein